MARLRVVTINDVYKMDNYPRLCKFMRRLREKSNIEDKVICVLPGDFISPSLISTLDDGKAMLEVLNKIPVDYVTFGNHEFDLEYDCLQQRIKEFNGRWLNSNVSYPSFIDRFGNPIPHVDEIIVGEKRVHIMGFCTNDMSNYSPKADMPIVSSPCNYFRDYDAKKENAPDLIIPLTHQSIYHDRDTCYEIYKNKQIKDKIPVIIGGHEHTIFREKAYNSNIIKVGVDAENIGLIDIEWSPELSVNIQMFESKNYDLDRTCQIYVDECYKKTQALDSMHLFQLDQGINWTSRRTRFEDNKLVSKLLTLAKKSIDCDVVLLNGGGVRDSRDYCAGPFSYGDLLRELPFINNMTIVKIPGGILEDTIRGSRNKGTEESPGFLHGDNSLICEPVIGADLKILSINKKIFSRNDVYRLAIDVNILRGMNELEPLVSYVAANGGFDEKNVVPLKDCIRN